MQELEGLFIGYKTVTSKKGKLCFIISLLFVSLDELNNRATYFTKDVFVDEQSYNAFLNEHQLLTSVDVKREIVGDTVRYYI